MSEITVVPTISAQNGGFLLRVESADAKRAWQKGYGSEQDAYIEAVGIGLGHDEYIGSTHRRKLEAQTSIQVERLEQFGFRETSVSTPLTSEN